MPQQLRDLVETTRLDANDIQTRLQEVYDHVLRVSPYLETGNFTRFHPNDLRLLYDRYDRSFFSGQCSAELGSRPLSFRISRRMTSAGAKTTGFTPRGQRRANRYEITVSSTLLFQTFSDADHRAITVTGILCEDRLEALQRLMEHELVHLIEMLLWTTSNCRAARFQAIASRFFGHTEHTHQLITPKERAFAKFRIRPGTQVRFRLDGREHQGMVNRITKRATVLVPDSRGEPFSDGRRYLTYYVPLALLEVVGGDV
jgi:hypothetical protein